MVIVLQHESLGMLKEMLFFTRPGRQEGSRLPPGQVSVLLHVTASLVALFIQSFVQMHPDMALKHLVNFRFTNFSFRSGKEDKLSSVLCTKMLLEGLPALAWANASAQVYRKCTGCTKVLKSCTIAQVAA